ncbi:MAG: ParA family protein [Saprospiraceae bacterium]|nr:ParA family protein [Saprospiraceae bacterium]
MASIIAVANLKGGVGKSTIAQNLGVSLRSQGHKVCLVDTDVEQKSTMEWGERREARELPAIKLSLATEDRMAREINELAKSFDFVIVDGSPALSEVATKIMMVADLVVVPVMPSGNDYGALEKFLARYDDVKAMLESKGMSLDLGVVLNGYNDRIIVNRAVFEAIKKLEVRIFNTEIGHRAAYQEANLVGMGVSELGDRKAAQEIESLTAEILSTLSQ